MGGLPFELKNWYNSVAMDTIICDLCGKEKPRNEVTLMQEGVGIRMSKNSRVIESQVRRYVESVTGKNIALFPHLCFECQRGDYFRQIMSGKSKS